MRDSYQLLFDGDYLKKDTLFKFGLKESIYCPKGKASESWEALKQKIKNQEKVFIRGFGRNGSGSIFYKEFYSEVLGLEVSIDPTNNSEPGKLMRELTGYSTKKVSARNPRYERIQNYQIAHVFGKTKNIYAFTAPWNIAYIPKIIDPFTGHEAQGEYVTEYQRLFRKETFNKFYDLIQDYNEIMSEPRFKEKITKFFSNKEDNYSKELEKSVKEQFAPITLEP